MPDNRYVSGNEPDGKTFALTITSPLEWTAACRFLVTGTIGFDVEGIEPFVLDYGTGECDALATLSRGDDQGDNVALLASEIPGQSMICTDPRSFAEL